MGLPQYEIVFLNAAFDQANGVHIFPDFAACEAGLESGYGHSALAHDDNNIFGMKQHVHPIFGTHSIPTKECLGGEWKVVDANWVKYPTLADAFQDRMNTLKRLAPHYAHYAAALLAPDGETFVREVSKTWSTDPERANKVLNISASWTRKQFGATPLLDANLLRVLQAPVPQVNLVAEGSNGAAAQ